MVDMKEISIIGGTGAQGLPVVQGKRHSVTAALTSADLL
jgi:hypothetical protein